MTLFQEFIKFSLGKGEALSHKLTEQDWLSLYAEAQRQSLFGVFMDGVERAVALGEAKPQRLMQWIVKVMALEQRNKLLDEKAAELTRIFADDGFKSCILKGQGVAKLYPRPYRRQCGDIDIWVEGGREKILAYLKGKYKIGSPVIHHVDVDVWNGVPVEVHFIPSFAYSPFRYRKFKRFFSVQAQSQFDNYSKEYGFATPTIEFNVVYSLMHIFHHVLHEGIGLRQLLDYYYILKTYKGNKEVIMRFLASLGLDRFAAAVMYVEKAFFDLEDEYLLCTPDVSLGSFLLDEIQRSGNFGKYDERNINVNRKNGWSVYLHNVKRNFVFFKFAPSEVLWAPIWKPCHFVWRMVKGYAKGNVEF
ncbi:nucleotidyltransferase family protein [uncultured Prevotella sp.]|uniref:nucleotidyltransferase family protein n=1 Tax=uncultured Prevotella sp. TaxID=159272 RepID=UPI0027E24323|nr:nucleotidyltransferase family protein [uncultured Prevotella sp.]